MKFSNGEINREVIIRFQNWYKSHYDYEAKRKFHVNLGNLLEWLRKRTGDDHFLEFKELLEPPKRNSKKISPIILREDDVKNVVRRIWRSDYDPFNKLRLITTVLFALHWTTTTSNDYKNNHLRIERSFEQISTSPMSSRR